MGGEREGEGGREGEKEGLGQGGMRERKKDKL